ncbi:putative pyridoxal phosphatase [Medicago truncatula]|nr:putative pyridoxal phosphatase [Medicago truncatula]
MEFVNLFTQKPKYDCLLFDLDDTLYPLSSGLAEACRQNFKDYMEEMLCIDPRKSDNLCTLLYKNYGTTLAGLKAIGYDFDYDELHSFVHGRLPYVNLKPDPVLRKMLMSLPYRKLIFTNADKVHALKTLNILGLEDCFEGIICFETLNPIHRSSVSVDEDDIEFLGLTRTTKPTSSNSASSSQIFDIIDHLAQTNPSGILPKSPIVCKPSENAIQLALKIANLDPHRTLFFEDSVRNIQAGKRVGLDTVLIGTSQKVQGADYALESIHNLPEAIPDLWEADLKSEVVYTGKLAVETTVTA